MDNCSTSFSLAEVVNTTNELEFRYMLFNIVNPVFYENIHYNPSL